MLLQNQDIDSLLLIPALMYWIDFDELVNHQGFFNSQKVMVKYIPNTFGTTTWLAYQIKILKAKYIQNRLALYEVVDAYSDYGNIQADSLA